MPEPLNFNLGLSNKESQGTEDPNNNPDQNQLSELGNGFLKHIEDESDRIVVSKYLTDWDKGVNEQFRKRDEEIKAWAELGDLETVQQALAYVASMADDPVAHYQRLTEALTERGLMPGLPKEELSNLPEYEGVPEELVQELKQLRTTSSELQTNYQQLQEQQEMRELDSWVKELHNEQGEFDDDWVISHLARYPQATGEDAVKAFHTMLENYGTPKKEPKETPPVPNLPRGGSSVLTEQVDISKMTREQRVDYLAGVLAKANAEQ